MEEAPVTLKKVDLETLRCRFTQNDELLLLREVLGRNPFEDPRVWETILRILRTFTGKPFTLRTIKDHVEYLIKIFIRDDGVKRKKSGIEECYGEMERLLQEVADLRREFSPQKNKNKLKKTLGQQVRDTAAKKAYLKVSNKENVLPSEDTEDITHTEPYDDVNEIQWFGETEEFDRVSRTSEENNSYTAATSTAISTANTAATPTANFASEPVVNIAAAPAVIPEILTPSHRRTRQVDPKSFAINYLRSKHEAERKLTEKKMELEKKKMELEERRVEVEERKVALEERKVTMEEEKNEWLIATLREQRKLIEEQQKTINQQQKLISELTVEATAKSD